jgi:hypothetical protein
MKISQQEKLFSSIEEVVFAFCVADALDHNLGEQAASNMAWEECKRRMALLKSAWLTVDWLPDWNPTGEAPQTDTSDHGKLIALFRKSCRG